MKTLSPSQRVKLLLALDDARAYEQADSAQRAILHLQANHGATLKLSPSTNTLRCAGVSATCTWSTDDGLLKAWRKNAIKRLGMLVPGAPPHA